MLGRDGAETFLLCAVKVIVARQLRAGRGFDNFTYWAWCEFGR
jgi:hypothetical protein